MKIKILLTLFSIGLMFSSCSRCKDCTCSILGSSVTTEVCKDDFGSTSEYKDAIKDIEDGGCDCK